MAQNPSKFIANTFLALTSSLGLRSTSRALKYARAAFKLYFLTSTVGALASVIDSATLQDLDEVIFYNYLIMNLSDCYLLSQVNNTSQHGNFQSSITFKV